jgi:NAD(P)-dependent dehydrogenase (short-subunit alcohol dehydrogenase family)
MKKRIAVVTGGNRGIGKDISRCFLDSGARVVNISRQQSDWKHERFETVIADLADRAATAQAGKAIAAKYQVDTFVHNAGVIRPAPLENVKLEDLDYLTDLHLASAITLAQSFLPAMRAGQFGRIVLLSSRGVLGLGTRTSYASTKAGQIGLTRTWALELAKDGITVNCVAPGPIETDMFHEIIPENSEMAKKVAAGIPVKRVGRPEDIGRVVHFLCEEASSFITGQTWYICGGASLGSLAL